MRSSLTSSPIPPVLRPFFNPKSLCSQPQFPNKANSSESPLSENHDSNTNFPVELTSCTPSQNPTFLESKHDLSTSSTSDTVDLTQTNVINTLLSCKNDPISAFRYFNRVERQRGFLRGIDSFCVLLHILTKDRKSHRLARNLLAQFFSGYSGPTSIVLVEHLVECAKRFDFDLHSRAFSDLLDSYVRAERINDAYECCHGLIERDIVPRIQVINVLLTALIQRNFIQEGKALYNKMILKGVNGDRVTVSVLMCACLREGNPKGAEDYYTEAKARGIEFDAVAYSILIEAFCRKPNLRMAIELLREIRDKEWVPSKRMYENVIGACVKQGNIMEALRLKDEMVSCGWPINVVVTTSLVKGYCKQGDLSRALDLFDKMKQDGPPPNKVTFTVLIEGCCKNGNVKKAYELYVQMKNIGVRPSVFIVNSLIRAFLKSWSEEEAFKLFDEAVESGIANVFTYNDLLSWLCKERKVSEACSLWKKMLSNGVVPSVVSYNNMILAHCEVKNMDMAHIIFTKMLAMGLKPNVITYTVLMDGYFKNGDAESALDLFDQMEALKISATDYTFNTIINGLCSHGLSSEGRDKLKKFVEKGFLPMCITYNSIIDGFVKEGDVNSALAVSRERCESGQIGNFSGFYGQNNGDLHQNTSRNYHNGGYREYQNSISGQDGKFSGYYVQNDVFSKQKTSEVYQEGLRSFEQNSNQNHQNYGRIYGESTEYQTNTFQQTGNFSGYDWVNNGKPQQNLNGAQAQILWSGQHNLNNVVGGNASMQNNYGSIQQGLGEVQNLNRFDSRGSSESEGSINGSWMQNAAQYQQNQNAGQYLWDQSLGQYQQNPNVGNYLPNSNDVPNGTVASQMVTKPEREPSEASENSQNNSTLEELDSLVKEGKVTEAVEVLALLEKQCVPVDLPRFLQLMQACGEHKALEEAKSVHEHIERSLSPLKVSIYNKILKMYSECGAMDDAFDVFNNMRGRNLTSWDNMITGLAKNGLGEDAVDLFSQFKQSGFKPDGQMFIGVLSACSVLGDINEGMLHFESMIKDYGIVPSMKHYVSIVDMLGSTGYLDEALEFIEKMPMEPTVDVWERLMNLCRIHGNLELGDHCAEFVEKLDPSRLNEKSKAGLVPVESSDLAKEKEKKKLSSQNLLEVRSRVHEYRAGDTSHPETDRIYAQIRGLKAQMKEAGYIPETRFVLHDVDQESKEEALLAHSERLAVSHGLLSSPARAPIRIIKNLRVCGDCHTALKIISKIVGRELIIRDAKRFHHFKDGLCSCRDYW